MGLVLFCMDGYSRQHLCFVLNVRWTVMFCGGCDGCMDVVLGGCEHCP